MAIEKKWDAIPARPFTANGTTDGQVTIASTLGFKVKQTVILKAGVIQGVNLEVKRVVSETVLLVGQKGRDINDRADLSAFTTALSATIEALEQPRNDIPDKEHERAVYAEEPIVAKRSILVDRLGRYFSVDNPIPVQLSDGSVNIGTVNAQLEMFLSHKDNDPDVGDVHSSMRIGDGIDELAINSDGSLNIVTVPFNPAVLCLSAFNSVASIPTNTTTTLVTYTAPAGKKSFLQKVEASGENIAKFEILVNGTVISTKRTMHGGGLNADFDFGSGYYGQNLNEGDVVTVRVTHLRPNVGDFEARIQALEFEPMV